jgi:cytochrome c oxidase subunit II
MPPSLSPVFDPASPQAAAIYGLFITVLATCGVILLVIVGLVGTSLIRFRQRPGSKEPPALFGNRKLEIIWTIGPAMIVIWLFVLTGRVMRLSAPSLDQQSDTASNQQPDLIVIAHQWWWEVHYPQPGVVTANEIHIPVGRKWLVRLQSADVIHDFWVPALGPKMDVVPGLTNYLWLEADLPDTYDGTCAEYCGEQHAWMRFLVVAESPKAFAAWLHEQKNPAALPTAVSAQLGLKTFQALTCVNCHSIRGVSVAANAAPDLTHLAGREMLGAGVLANTEANLFLWLKNPQAVKPGCFMPNLKLTDAQANALVSYLETLQ